jgi:DNA-binding NarL/FixJ family response regulator
MKPKTTQPYRIVLADDHQMFRLGIRHIIERISGLEVVGEAGDGMEILRLLRKMPVDMVVLDISMPLLRGIEAITEIKTISAKTKVLILTMHQNTEYFYHAVAAGADGYLLKADAGTVLEQAIQIIRKGHFFISPILSSDLTNEMVHVCRSGTTPDKDVLTVRQKEILTLIAEGKTNTEIASCFNISRRTVEHHRTNLMQRLGLKNTAELVRYAFQKEILPSRK